MDLDATLAHIDPGRRDAVAQWLSSSLNDCESCGRPVRPIDPRRLDGGMLVHLDCGTAAPAATPEERVSKSVAA